MGGRKINASTRPSPKEKAINTQPGLFAKSFQFEISKMMKLSNNELNVEKCDARDIP